jgi:ABC-2 type transport system ATP-binding protein
MDRCRIREVRQRLIGTLSRGYRQRVGLADSLSHQPPVLIMDEPTSGLDPLQIRETLQTIKDLAAEHTILFSTHILAEVEAICQRMIVIHKGRLLADQSMAELTRDDTRHLTVEVQAPAEAITAAIKALPGVAKVSIRAAQDGWLELDVRVADKADPREAIFREVVKHQGSLRRLETRRRRLDDYFYDLIRRADEAPAVA